MFGGPGDDTMLAVRATTASSVTKATTRSKATAVTICGGRLWRLTTPAAAAATTS